MKRIDLVHTHFTPQHPIYGALRPSRLPTYKFDLSKSNPEAPESPPAQAGWEWIKVSDLTDAVNDLPGTRPTMHAVAIVYFTHENFGCLTNKRVVQSAAHRFNFIVVDPDPPHGVSTYFGIPDFTSVLRSDNADSLLVPAGWAAAVFGLIQAGVWIVNSVPGPNAPESDPEQGDASGYCWHGHSYDFKRHFAIMWSPPLGRWVWQEYTNRQV